MFLQVNFCRGNTNQSSDFPNFGIVTQLTYQTIPLDKVWFARWNFAPEDNQKLLDALVTYHELAANDTKAGIVFQLSVDPDSASSFVGFFYEDPVEYPPVFAPFYESSRRQ